MRRKSKTVLPRSRGRVTRALKKRKAKTAAIVASARIVKAAEQNGDRVDVAMHRTPLDRIKVGKRYRKDFGDLVGLARSINERGGLIHPIALTPDGTLIAGERRLRAWKLSKFSKLAIPSYVIDIDSILAGEWDENAPGIRKDFNWSEAVAIKQALEPKFKAEAAARMKAGKRAEPGVAGSAGDKVAGMVGVDRKTLAKAEAVVEAARDNPEKFGGLLEQMDRTGRAHGPFKRLENMRASAKIKAEPPPLPGKGPYRTGVIDLPWASEPDGASPSETGRGYYNYPTMNTPEMIAFGDKVVPLLHPEGGHVWIWTTNFHLLERHAFKVIDAWSAKAEAAGVGPIRPIGKRTWAKDVMGRGQVFRGQTEDVILCAFGKSPPALGAVLSTLLNGPVRADSEKPEQFYADVELATPAPRYFELFARRVMPENWDGFGDQVGTLGPTIFEQLQARQDAAAEDPAPPAPALPVESFGDDELANTLAAIERGEDVAPRLIKKHKLADVGYVSTGGAKPKLKAAGRTLLAARRETAAEARDQAAKLAELPDAIDGMIADYRETVRRMHVAVLGGNGDAYATAGQRLELLEVKANGGTSFGMASDDSPAEQLRQAASAPIGEVPAWGERGMFVLDIAGTPYLTAAEHDGGFSVHAMDPDKPFGSKTGFRSFVSMGIEYGGRMPPAQSRDEFCRAEIEQWLAGDDEHDRKKKGRPIKLYRPARWYVLPASWDGVEHCAPPISIGCLMFERGVLNAIAAKVKIQHHADTIDNLRRSALIDDKGKITKNGRQRLKQLDAEIAERSPPALAAATPAAAEPALPGFEPPAAEDETAAPPARASDVRAAIDAKVTAGAFVEVRINSHRALYEAFDAISHDAGAGAGYAAYPVPAAGGDVDGLAADMVAIEAALAELVPADLETFAIGEQTEAAAIAARSADLAKAHGLLGAFARGWYKDDGEPPAPSSNVAEDQLEIPAFLRRTADSKAKAAA